MNSNTLSQSPRRGATLAAAVLMTTIGVMLTLVGALLTRPQAVKAAPNVAIEVAAPPVQTTEISAALRAWLWLRATQNPDGSITTFAAPGTTGAVLDSAEAVLAARSLGIAPASIVTGSGRSLLGALQTPTATAAISANVSAIGRIALAVAAADLDPRSFGELNLVVSMTRFYSPTTGAFGSSNWDQALSMLGWRAAGEVIPVTATRLLASRAISNGGFEFDAGFGTDTNSTGLVLQALAAGGHPVTSTEIVSALVYLKALQKPDGGWGYDAAATASDANSTAYVVQGLLAVGEDPVGAEWQVSGVAPISFLLAQQQPDGGIGYQGAPSNRSATAQSIPALLGKIAPYRSRQVGLRISGDYLRRQLLPDGSFPGFGVGSTIDAINAFVATNGSIETIVSISNTTPLQYLASQSAYARSGAAQSGKYAVGIVAAGGDPRSVAGFNAVLSMSVTYSPTTGRYGASVWDQSWVLIGLSAAREPISPTQVSRLIAMASPGGGFGFSANDSAPDVDSTGLALMALKAGGVPITDTVVQASVKFLRDNWLPDSASPSVDSIGLTAQGLCAYDQDARGLDTVQPITANNTSRLVFSTPLDALLAAQNPDGTFKTPFSVPVASYAGAQGLRCSPLPLLRTAAQSQRVFLPLSARGSN